MAQLESDESPARKTPAARHQDALAPGKIVRDRSVESPSQRVGDGTPEGPVVSFPDDEEPSPPNR